MRQKTRKSQARMVGSGKKISLAGIVFSQQHALNNRLRAQRRTLEQSGTRAGSLQHGAARSAESPQAICSQACCRQRRL